MVASMGYGTFIFFGLMCVFAAIFVYWFVPETKNLTLEEMDEVFGDEAGTGKEDRDRLNRIMIEVGLLTHEELGMSNEKISGDQVSGESHHVVEKL
jgi:hypothetical protein